jgi:hypothetical protein
LHFLAFTGLHWPSLAFTGLHWPSLAFTGLHWYDLKADPTPAFSENEISSSGNPCRIAVKNGIAFFPNSYEGLLLLEEK